MKNKEIKKSSVNYRDLNAGGSGNHRSSSYLRLMCIPGHVGRDEALHD